ncbi:hypothetical protein [Asanoa siamensis]|uniref:Uncharacterized protein n=1 Tax=Asanoa siamensis TaxID=926357 RepID=A0ABQ4CRQ6_9ACTN|nr:hypothetical protein [Asanoa siamensis]GIF73967.1 hypothetical protein Asi02nite_34850 [Asanoa siamensis]
MNTAAGTHPHLHRAVAGRGADQPATVGPKATLATRAASERNGFVTRAPPARWAATT